jgi:hypothetical protein
LPDLVVTHVKAQNLPNPDPDGFYGLSRVRRVGVRFESPDRETRMRKMKLDMDKLAVESFAVVAGDADSRGTVEANQGTRLCTMWTCGGDTCDLSCTGSCRTGYNCQQVC